MKMRKPIPAFPALGVRARQSAFVLAYVGMAALTAFSAILAKEAGNAPVLAGIEGVRVATASHSGVAPLPHVGQATIELNTFDDLPPAPPEYPPDTRWFDGRPVRPAGTMTMVVTGYSPDWRSCGPFADGKTATLHSVETNGHQLVAADTSVLPYGSLITIPGYSSNKIVPVLDCGGAIKGRRLDVLFPTHEQARQWGVKKLTVTIWKYADGKPAVNPRKLR